MGTGSAYWVEAMVVVPDISENKAALAATAQMSLPALIPHIFLTFDILKLFNGQTLLWERKVSQLFTMLHLSLYLSISLPWKHIVKYTTHTHTPQPLHPPFPPHPSQCLCKPPRSYTWPPVLAQAPVSPKSILLTRTVMSLWFPSSCTEICRGSKNRRCSIQRLFEV